MNSQEVLIRLLSGPKGTLVTFAISCGVKEGVDVKWDVIYEGYKVVFTTLRGDVVHVRCYRRSIWVEPMPVCAIYIESSSGAKEKMTVGPFIHPTHSQEVFRKLFQEVTSLDPYLFQ